MNINYVRRAGGELVYALSGLPLGIVGFVLTVVTLSVSGGLAITLIGLPLLAASGIAAAWLASGYRTWGNTIVPDAIVPGPVPSGRGWLQGGLRDGVVWRARLYLVLKLPLGILSFVAATVFYVYGLGAVSYATWRPFLPKQHGHRGMQLWNDHYVDTFGSIALLALVGAILLALAPPIVHGVVTLDRKLVRALLS